MARLRRSTPAPRAAVVIDLPELDDAAFMARRREVWTVICDPSTAAEHPVLVAEHRAGRRRAIDLMNAAEERRTA